MVRTLVTLLLCIGLNVLSAQNIEVMGNLIVSDTISIQKQFNAAAGVIGTNTLDLGDIFKVGSLEFDDNLTVDQIQNQGSNSTDNFPMWQSITAGITGNMGSISFNVSNAGTFNLNLKIYSGEGTDGVLLFNNTKSVPILIFGGVITFDNFTVPIQKDSIYTLRVNRVSGNNGFMRSQGGNPYPGGKASFNENRDLQFTTEVYKLIDLDIFRVTDSGNVGIGVDSATSQLDIQGPIRIREAASLGFIPVSDADGVMTWTDPSTITTAADGDGDSGNELSDLNLANDILTLTNPLTGNNQIDLSIYNDEDGDPNNELADLNLSNDILSLTNPSSPGNQVDLSVYKDGDGDASNELTDLSLSNDILTLTNPLSGGNQIDLSIYNDGDGDASNELTNLSLSNDILTLTNPLSGSNQVDLSSYSSKWGMAANDIYFQTGNVGIGTSMPASLLEVAGIKKDILNIKTLDNAMSQGIAFQRSGANYNWNIFRNAQNSDALTFAGGNTDLASLSELVTIMTDGKVGIGTNTPDVELSIAGKIRSAFDAAETSYVEIGHEGSKSFIKNVGGSKLDFLSNGNQLLMSLYSTGNLSIGSGGSTNKLDVSGEMAIGPAYAGIESAPDRGLIVEGNVGIGLVDPVQQFEVQDNAGSGYVAAITNSNGSNAQTLFINSKNTATGNALVVQGHAGKNTGTLWTVTSDQRLKTDIKPYQEGLEELLKVNPVTFHYNEKSGNPTEEEHVGVIAQELQQIAPYMVEEFEKDGETYLNVNASPMLFMFVNAIQEQQEMIEELQKENLKLKSTNAHFESEHDQMKTEFHALLKKVNAIEAHLSSTPKKDQYEGSH